MLRFYASRVLWIVDDMTKFASLAFPGVGVTWYSNETLNRLKAIRDHIGSLGLPVSVACANRFIGLIERGEREREEADTEWLAQGRLRKMLSKRPTISISSQELMLHATQLMSAFRDELAGVMFFAIPTERAPYYEQKEPLCDALVLQQFPASAYDIDEAGKCFAVERSTAAVFHLMRAMERAVTSVARCLQIPPPIKRREKNWGAIARAIDKEIKRRDQAIPVLWKNANDKEFFDETYVLLEAVRSVWRNKTMHVEGKYTPEEAGHIFNAVRAFLIRIATRLDENGGPQA